MFWPDCRDFRLEGLGRGPRPRTADVASCDVLQKVKSSTRFPLVLLRAIFETQLALLRRSGRRSRVRVVLPLRLVWGLGFF